MSSVRVCPHCGNNVFAGFSAHMCVISTNIDAEGNHGFVMQREAGQAQFPLDDALKCMKCHAELRTKDLVEGVPCVKCGRNVSPAELKDGLCPVCQAKQTHPEFDTMSKDDLIMMLIQKEQQSNNVINNIASNIAKAEEVSEKITNATTPTKRTRRKAVKSASTEIVTQEQENAPTEETMTSENTTANETVTEEEVNESIKDISDGNAPFPEVSPIVNEEETKQEKMPVLEEPNNEELI